MAKDSGGISGLAVTMATIGGFLVFIGIRNVPFLEGLREILKGKTPAPRPTIPGSVPPELAPDNNPISGPGNGGGGDGGGNQPIGNSSGSSIVAAAEKYLGVPYVWGGHSKSGVDCSGLVTLVLKDVGITGLPSMTHTVTGQFLVWSGASTIARSGMAAGDLVCWTGHIGIAVDNTSMIHAPTFGQPVQRSKVWNIPAPVIRRVKGISGGSSNGGGGVWT